MICDLDTKMWSDTWFENLKPNAKLLFIYLWGNDHKNLPCLYEISKKTMANETGFTLKEINKLLITLEPKVRYSETDNIIWVVNSVRRQFLKSTKVSPKIVKGIENALCLLPHGHPLIKDFLNKYKVLNISYIYTIEDYTYPTGEEEGVSVGKGEGEGEEPKHKYGKYKNVLLTDKEHGELAYKFREDILDKIKEMDEAIEMKGYKYKSHYLAILNWSRNNKQSKEGEWYE
ncbi:hypothetical protein LCGC14_1291020 [marine sediment metagenome]|uniref:Uncharacterized protein n=1 Tax=marine sediment metagenome TaxID=412755 RepID=A0A0F9N8Y9_9ZZZZ